MNTPNLTLMLPQIPRIDIHLVGCGGTGSWLAPTVVRVVKILIEKYRKDVSACFWDPQDVEEKNIFRQNFSYAEIGMNKAEALAYRYGTAWGVPIHCYPVEFSTSDVFRYSTVAVVIGCVDNNDARRKISKLNGKNFGDPLHWWLDTGNGKDFGQVVVGCGIYPDRNPFLLEGYTTWLPWPSVLYPEMLKPETETAHDINPNMSCADLAMMGEQGLAINQRVAAEAGDYLVRMLLTKDLQKRASFVDLRSGNTQSEPITGRILDELPKRALSA